MLFSRKLSSQSKTCIKKKVVVKLLKIVLQPFRLDFAMRSKPKSTKADRILLTSENYQTVSLEEHQV